MTWWAVCVFPCLARALDLAKDLLEASRARLALAMCNVEGRRRFILLESVRETMSTLHKFFADGVTVMASLDAQLQAE